MCGSVCSFGVPFTKNAICGREIFTTFIAYSCFSFGWHAGVEMVMHVMQMIEKQKVDCNTCDCRIGKGRVIKSLGEDTRVAHFERSAKSNWRRTVALSRRKRMVAHNIADVSQLFAVIQQNPGGAILRDGSMTKTNELDEWKDTISIQFSGQLVRLLHWILRTGDSLFAALVCWGGFLALLLQIHRTSAL